MRVIAGRYKSLQIPMPKGGTVRPTTDRAREGLFNILHNRYDFESLRVLDLFMGSGAVSLEFISRGVPELVAVEKNSKLVKQVMTYSQKLGISDLQFVVKDVMKFIKSKHEDSFDLIFADPPYNMLDIESLPKKVLTSGLLRESGVLILEHHQVTRFNQAEAFEQRAYGQSVFSFFSN